MRDAASIKIPYFGDTACARCGDGIVSDIVWANGRTEPRPSIPSWCIRCDSFLANLPIDEYGKHFDMDRKRQLSQPADYRINQRRRFEILERDGFACVYCREPAARTDIEKLRAIEVSVSNLVDAEGNPGIYQANELEVQTFFGHDADHLFTVSDRILLKEHIGKKNKGSLDHKIRERWVVTACAKCNNGRKGSPMPYRTLISIYGRHLFESSGEADWDDLEDFMSVLKMLRYVRWLAAKKAL